MYSDHETVLSIVSLHPHRQCLPRSGSRCFRPQSLCRCMSYISSFISLIGSLSLVLQVRYSKLIKPVPIPSSNQTLLQNLSSAYYRVSKIFDFSSLWGSSTTAAAASASKQSGAQAKEQAEQQKQETTSRLNEIKQEASKQASEHAARPGNKRMPSEMPKFGMGKAEFEWVGRAEKRMKALNPSGTVDYFLPAEG